MAKKYNNPLLVAVTGGIGSGQTTVCNFLKEWRCKVISADTKAKQVIYRDRRLQSELRKAFGSEIFFKNFQLNTTKLAELAFRDAVSTSNLNQIVHPKMVESLVEEMEQARFSGRYPIIVIDAALIYEINIENMFDAVILVYAPLHLREKRVIERDNMTKKDFHARVSKQIPLEEKLAWADYVVKNNGDIERLKSNTKKVYDSLMQLQKKQNHIIVN